MFPRDARIETYDPELARAIADEARRQEDHVELIASENYASPVSYTHLTLPTKA